MTSGNHLPTPGPEMLPAGEQQEDSQWFDNGLSALEYLEQKHVYQGEATTAGNRFLKLRHASTFPDPGIITHRRQERDATAMAKACELQAKYHVALALGIEADDPRLPESGGSLNIQNPQHRGYLDAAFYVFLGTYDNLEVGGHIQRIRNGQEELQLRQAIDVETDWADEQDAETETAEPLLPEELTRELTEWVSQSGAYSQSQGNQERLFKSELTPTQLYISQGALCFVGAQVAISIENRRETYDPVLHGRSTPPQKEPQKSKPPLGPVGILRERLRKFRTDDLIKTFADMCILHGSGDRYVAVLKRAGYLPKDYKISSSSTPEKIVNLYRRQFGHPSDEDRARHKDAMEEAAFSPMLHYSAPKPRSKPEAQGRQDHLF